MWENLIQTCFHRDKLPKDTAEYSNDDNNDSHKCDDSTGQQSVKRDCLLDDEESDHHNNSSERHYPTEDHEQVKEDDKDEGICLALLLCSTRDRKHNFPVWCLLPLPLKNKRIALNYIVSYHTKNSITTD